VSKNQKARRIKRAIIVMDDYIGVIDLEKVITTSLAGV